MAYAEKTSVSVAKTKEERGMIHGKKSGYRGVTRQG